MIKIYHNPRCSKSRQTLAILEEKVEQIEIIKYIENPPTAKELSEIIDLLGIEPIDLVRKHEYIWKENYSGKSLKSDDIILIMVQNPKLIERPIVVKNNNAVIGRPPERVLTII